MNIYLILKTLHVLAAITWVGGGLACTALMTMSGRDGDRLLRTLGVLAPIGAVMGPSSLVVMLTGGLLVWTGAWGFAPWIAVSLACAGTGFLIGAFKIGPAFGRVGRMLAEGDRRGALAQVAALTWPGRIEQALLITTVVFMVVKPAPADMAPVGLILAVLFAAIAAQTRMARRPTLA